MNTTHAAKKETEARILTNICAALSRGNVGEASQLLGQYRFKQIAVERRTMF